MSINTTKAAFEEIEKRRARPWANEEEVRIAWVSALERALGIHFDAERAQKDSSYNNIIIEFKAPGSFKSSKSSAKFLEATDKRLLPYIKSASISAGIPQEDFIGIAIDGEHICFVQVRDGKLHVDHLIPFSEYAVGLVIQAVRADTRRAVTIDNLLNDFGHGAANARALMQAMADGLAAELAIKRNSKIKMLFEEWRTLYGQVADMSALQAEAIKKEMGFVWRGANEHSMAGRLFIIHTYNSLLIKLLAAEIVSAHNLTTIQRPAQAMAAEPNDSNLLNKLNDDIEKAGIFTQAGINGFVEEAIFSWYLDIASKPQHGAAMLAALRGVLASLSLYRTDHLARTRDVLRDLYQGLVPGKLRQSLGEYYTPDWLVDYTLEAVGHISWLERRVLDPTCGSGAFLLAVIRRMRSEAASLGWDASKTVQHICDSVWGFDLNPLAVQTARVNVLMQIADLLRDAPGQSVEVPVLLADAIYSPAPSPELGLDTVSYRIGSQVAGLDIRLPSALAFDRSRLDQVFSQMGEDVEKSHEFAKTEKNLLLTGLMSSGEAKRWRDPLKYTYDQILNLHRNNWNGIWFRIVRNFFWSATAGHFDIIVGNPPWVRWSKLPDTYRERVKPTCERYGIFSKNKRHGGNELDISAMITYTTADKWLKLGGRLAFVITGTIFKNPSSAGFRDFRLNPIGSDTLHLTPISVDDMKGLKPFDDASNHTVVAVFDKSSSPATYPVPYRVWSNAPGATKAIPVALNLKSVKERVIIDTQEAAPVDAAGSPWAVLPRGRIAALEALSGTCGWVSGRKGITTDLNGVYFVPVVKTGSGVVQIQSRPQAGKKDIGPVKTAWVEPKLLYPLVKGAGDFEACYLRLDAPGFAGERLYTFVPNRGISPTEYDQAGIAMNSTGLSKTKAWFSGFKTILSSRSTYRRQMHGAPFFSIYNVGDYTFQPWKVVWPEMSRRFYAAVSGSAAVPLVGRRPYVPDHKIYFAGFDDKEPAYFLCGLLNSPMVREWVESHNVSIQVGDIFKHMRLPKYRPGDTSHRRLSKLVEKAHGEHDALKRKKLVSEIEMMATEILKKMR